MNKFLQKASAVSLIISGVAFASIAILAIWEVLKNDELIWRSLGTLTSIALASLFVNIGAKIYKQTSHR